MNADEIIKQLNTLIQRGVIDVSMNNPDSLSVAVWGIKQAKFHNLSWKELKGKFLGGGIYESYGYELKLGNHRIVKNDYIESLRLFLSYVNNQLGFMANGNKGV